MALAPLSAEYERVMRWNLEWHQHHRGACDAAMRAKADSDPSYREIRRGFPAMAKRVHDEVKVRCADHPGFGEAFRDGILFMVRPADDR